MTSTLRTIRLRERQARICRLRRIDLVFLLAHHGRHLEIEFTQDRHWYRLTPRGFAGVISAPTCQLWIGPKLPWDNFARLLDLDQQWLGESQGNIGQSPRALPDFLLDRFLNLLRQRIEMGLLKGYAERFEELAQVRGRIDMAVQVRLRPGLPDRFACHFDELSVDIPCNRLAKSIGEWLLSSPWLDNRARSCLNSLLVIFTEVESIDLSTADFERVSADPRAASYRPLLELGQLFLHSHSAAPNHVEMSSSFLIDMEQLFEHYVSFGVQRILADSDAAVEVQPRLLWHDIVPGQPELQLRPDLIVRRTNNCSIVDVKWKDFTGQPDGDDLHQILAYAGALNATRAVLLYPGRKHKSISYPMRDGRTLVEFTMLRMVGSPDTCERSLRRFTRQLAFE